MDGEAPTPSLHNQSIQGLEIEATCCGKSVASSLDLLKDELP